MVCPMTTFSCPNCQYPLLTAENLPAMVTKRAELRYDGPELFPARDEPSPPSSEPAKADEELSVNRREYGDVMAAVEAWCAAEPWAGWEPSRDLFAGFKGWVKRERNKEVGITQNRFSGMLGELGSVWDRTNTGRVYSLPPQFRPDSMAPLTDPVAGGEVPTDTVPGGGEPIDPNRLCNSCELPYGHEGPCGEPWRPGSDQPEGSPPAGEEPATDDADHAGAGPREGSQGPAAAAVLPQRSSTFPAHTVDCALAATSGVAPCDCGATPPHPVVGDEPAGVEGVLPPAVAERAAAGMVDGVSVSTELPTPDAGFVVPRSDAAADALGRRQAAADPLAAPLVPVDQIVAGVAAGAAAEDARLEQAAAVSRAEFLRGGPSPFAPGVAGEDGE